MQRMNVIKDHNNNIVVSGWLYLPENVEKCPLVIISHGLSSSHLYTGEYAEYLASQGYACYVYDFCGGSNNSLSDGRTVDMSIATEEEDLRAVYQELSQLEYLDTDQIFLMGKSQGGLVSALVAAELKDKVAGLILLYPAFVIPDDARKRFASLDDVPETVSIFGMEIGRPYYESVLDMDVWKEVKGYTGNVMIFHGTADTTVPISYAEEAVQVYEHAQLEELPGVGHGFYGATFVHVCQEIAATLDKWRK